jgi:hypothetical protein
MPRLAALKKAKLVHFIIDLRFTATKALPILYVLPSMGVRTTPRLDTTFFAFEDLLRDKLAILVLDPCKLTQLKMAFVVEYRFPLIAFHAA